MYTHIDVFELCNLVTDTILSGYVNHSTVSNRAVMHQYF